MQIDLEVRKRVSERIALQNQAENVYNSCELPFDDIDYRNPRNWHRSRLRGHIVADISLLRLKRYKVISYNYSPSGRHYTNAKQI